MRNYDETRRDFRWPAPPHFNFASDVVDRWASGKDGDAVAMRWIGDTGERELTFRHFAERSDRLANALEGRGLGPGDGVLVMLPRVVEWWESLLGLEKARCVAMPATTLLTPKDIDYRLDAASASAVITDAANAEKVDAAPRSKALKAKIVVGGTRPGWDEYDGILGSAAPGRKPSVTPADEPSLLYFTSGTTGHPKMVLHTHASIGLGHEVTGRFWLDLGPGDLHWNISDTGWAKAAWSSFFGPWTCGATLLVQHSTGSSRHRDPPFSRDVSRDDALRTPTVYGCSCRGLANVRSGCPTLRHCVAAGEPLNPKSSRPGKGDRLVIREGTVRPRPSSCAGTFRRSRCASAPWASRPRASTLR